MIKNWQLTAYLLSPLAGDPPRLDAVLMRELAQRMGMSTSKITRDTPLSEVMFPPIPLVFDDIDGRRIYHCSDPILPTPRQEWVDYHAKRLESDKAALLLREDQRKKLLVASGPYKMRRAPARIRLVNVVVYFVRGDRKEINKLTKKIRFLGKHTNIGYGMVERWEFFETEEDLSIYAVRTGKRVLMKTLPAGECLRDVCGYRLSYGAASPPYWHPENYSKIGVPA